MERLPDQCDLPAVVDVLVSRPGFASILLEALLNGALPRGDVSSFHARQIRSFKNPVLTGKLTDAWGAWQESDQEKQEQIALLKTKLTPVIIKGANLRAGRELFGKLCSSCHTLYGQGGRLGPDLTGSGRHNFDCLLENMVDPSGTVSAEYQISTLTLKDGRSLSGVLTTATDRTCTLRTLTETVTVEKVEVTNKETSLLSMMPEGLLHGLSEEAVRDLVGYLMHPRPVE